MQFGQPHKCLFLHLFLFYTYKSLDHLVCIVYLSVFITLLINNKRLVLRHVHTLT